MKRILQFRFKILLLITFISSATMTAQTVDLVANVDVTPPLNIGQTFTYTIQAVAGANQFQGVQVYLNYNPAVIQLNTFTPDTSVLNVPLANDTSTSGIIQYSAGTFVGATGSVTIFTAVFQVVGTSESVMITHDLFTNGNPNGTAVGNSGGQNITGTTNDIILSTLSTETYDFNTSLSVYPNPVNDILNIKLSRSSSEIESIQIHTIDGRLVKNYNAIYTRNFQINMQDLNHALYLVTVRSTKNDLATLKILVN